MLRFQWSNLLLSMSLVNFASGIEEFDFLNRVMETNDSSTGGDTGSSDLWPPGELNCAHGFREFNDLTQKKVYKVGVHAPSGEEEAWRQFNLTFVTYLNEAAGKRFIPPIEFEMTVSVNPIADWVDKGEDVDFMYADTGIFSCIETEIGAQPLGTTITHLEARGHEYKLDVVGGMIFARADNVGISKTSDLKDKVIGAVAMSDFSGAQAQFWEMNHDGSLDYIMDPKQIVFSGDQEDVVLGVLDGRYDAGLVRTGMFERTVDPSTGELVDSSLFQVLEPKVYTLDDGTLFPFVHSTPVFPEWPLFARARNDRVVAEEVVVALINFEYHFDIGMLIHNCIDQATNDDEMSVCLSKPPSYFDPTARCDTTRELAELAFQAGKAGRHAGLRPARSYGVVRSMQEDAGLLLQDENTGGWFCKRASSTYESFICPPGHYKVGKEMFDQQCDILGLPCPEGSSCYCKPCVEAFEVEVSTEQNPNCDKMSLCGSVEQTELLDFTIRDNLNRPDAEVTALVHIGQREMRPSVIRTSNTTNLYKFSFSNDQRGVAILEVFVNSVQIQQSPFRVQVIDKQCEGHGMVSNDVGVCECGNDTIEINGNCLDKGIFAAIMAAVGLAICLQLGLVYFNYKRRKSDEMWQISAEELHFDNPVQIVGQGAFGVVLMAEYRGTKTAIKRVLPLTGRAPGRGSVGASAQPDEPLEEEPEEDLEAASQSQDKNELASGNRHSVVASNSGHTLDFLGSIGLRGRKKGLSRWLPFKSGSYSSGEYNLNILGTASGGSSTTRTMFARILPWCDETSRRQEEFKEEMRLLSRLRHPCITTVMGAVMNGCEPMMVMEYMENGSLYDLLRNETLYTGGEIIIQILRDIAQGLRFLHASRPPILHGDLKAKNILVDSRFRAKVCDFGLSTKKKNGLSGTPFWMAPEYLRMKTEYTPACDIYSFGIILYEIFSRKNPYEGEHPRKVLRKVCDPRINYRPPVPDTCPKRLAEIMQKCWNADLNFRPEAKDLDLIFTDMNPNDAEPVIDEKNKRVRTQVATGDLLYKVFPRKVADQLKLGQKVEPETHDNVTVFFSDIVRFTDISQSLSAVKVSNMLDRLYLAFDELSSKHDVFKVETVGDAWMGVTNLENDQNDTHVRRIAEFAVDAVEAANRIPIDEDDPSAGFVHIRVGFHSGQVVSSVIGSLNPRYGLFGDTVNTAARMESLSLSGKIQCTEAAANILKVQAPDFPLRKRGKIAVKGKGSMRTYFVGEALLQEEADGSISRTFDEHPVVAFEEPPQSPQYAKPFKVHARPPTRINMNGSLVSGPPVSPEDSKSGNFCSSATAETDLSSGSSGSDTVPKCNFANDNGADGDLNPHDGLIGKLVEEGKECPQRHARWQTLVGILDEILDGANADHKELKDKLKSLSVEKSAKQEIFLQLLEKGLV